MPNDTKPELKSRPIAGYVVLGAALFAFIHAFALLSSMLLSFVLILLVSLSLNPITSRLRAWPGGRRWATVVITLAVVLIVVVTALGSYGSISAAVLKLSEKLPVYWERFQKPLIKMEQQSVRAEKRLQAEVRNETSQEGSDATGPPGTTKAALPEVTEERVSAEVTSREASDATGPPDTTDASLVESISDSGSLRSSLMQAVHGVAGSFVEMAFNTAQIMVVLLTVFFGVMFALMNPRPIVGLLFLIVPERYHEKALTIAQRVGYFVPRWAGATLLGMLTIGFLVFLLMWPIFGFFDALVLALIAGILEAIPYVGPILAAVPALLLALGEGGTAPLWVVLAYIMIQVLENNVIYPLIMSRGLQVHPVALIFSMLLCVAAFGVLGVLIAAPLVAVLRILHEELYRERFLPTTTDAALDRLARKSLHEKICDDP